MNIFREVKSMIKKLDTYEQGMQDIRKKRSDTPSLAETVEKYQSIAGELMDITSDLVMIEGKVMGPTLPIEIVTGEILGDNAHGYMEKLDCMGTAMNVSISNINKQLERLKQGIGDIPSWR